MTDGAVKPQLDLVTGMGRNLHYCGARAPGGKYDLDYATMACFGPTAIPIFQRLSFQTNVLGRYTDDDVPAHDFLLSEGACLLMHRIDGPGALNVILMEAGDVQVLRVVRPRCRWEPTPEEGDHLSRSRAVAVVLGGSMDPEYTEFVISAAAARGKLCFWNAGGKADLQLAGVGEVYLQLAYAEFGNGKEAPASLARRLLVSTGAAGVVVTDSARGAFGVLREAGSPLLEAPAIPLVNQVVRPLGAGDAHMAGFVSGFLNAPSAIRLERALHLGRLQAARHVAGLPVGDWYQLGLFQKQFDPRQIVPIRAAA